MIMHPAAWQWVAEWSDIDAHTVLDFGGRDINGTVRDIFTAAEKYVAVDLVDGPGVDMVADAATVTIDPGTWDMVVCCEVLEHVDDTTAAAILSNARRHLRPGGRLVVTAAGPSRPPHSAVDGGSLRDNESYRAVTGRMLRAWLALFSTVLVDELDDDVRAVAWR